MPPILAAHWTGRLCERDPQAPKPLFVHTVTTEEQPVPGLDPLASARWLHKPRNQSPWLHEEVASRMVERLACFRTLPRDWVHVEPVLGGLSAHRALRQRLPQAPVWVMAENGPRAQAATEERLGRWSRPWTWGRRFRPALAQAQAPVDLVWANMLLHLSPTPMRWMRSWLQQLRVQGFVLFSCLGPDSLRELRQVHSHMAWPEPAHAFTDMHDWGDMLVQVGFAEPVMDMERLTLTYPHAEAMLLDLRDMGRNLAQDRWGLVQGRAGRRRWIEAVEAHGPRDGQGRLTLTFELIYGHAAKAPPRLSVGPTTAVPLQAMRDMLRPAQRPQ